MTHANAPLNIEGRRRLVERCRSRPIAHVAAEAGVSRACLSKWKNRYDTYGEAGLQDRSSVPHSSPTQTSPEVVERIEQLRRDNKWSARRIALELANQGVQISERTVGRWLARLGINHRRFLDPDGSINRRPSQRIVARYPGHMVHLDVKKAGRIPDGGGWRAHGRDSEQARTAQRAKTAGAKGGYVYLHSAVDGFSRLAYTEPLPDEKAATTVAFFSRARAFFAAHGIHRIVRVVTDNGANYRAAVFVRSVTSGALRHQRTKPYTPRHNGKVERYQRILAEELLYARTWSSEAERTRAIAVWNVHYNYHRPHTTAGNRPPASRLPTSVTNVMASNT
ncbi:IS481 family transposase [Streptomyces sp. ISL-96]|uniref:IS481 family transposase n=1 Tax=Streptomyces sp. ISL-96 TaxID=2819191 RepID=UPI001BE54FB4|nr:IS481 family transposase [Streptomyces sp. ISL-96]MBT2493308.1 IS481 family transposase [Streptomyces sp. ISL-96]